MEKPKHQLSKSEGTRIAWAILVSIFVMYVFSMSRLSFAKYDSFSFVGYDLGIFTQATWLISQGRSPFLSIRGVHLLGDHFSLILYLIAPIFRLFPHPKTLLFLQTLALGAGVFPVFLLAHRRLKSKLSALLFAALYLLFPATQSINLAEFHPDTFAVPALLTAMLCFEKQSWKWYGVMLCLALMTKETLGIILIVWGATQLPANRKAGIATMAAGLAGLAVANLSIRAFNGGHPTSYLWIYHQFGTTLPQIAKAIIFNPATTWSVLNTGENQNVALLLFLPLAFLPILQPLRLLPALPALLSVALSSRSWMHNIDQWSLCPAIPFLFDSTLSAYLSILEGLAENEWKLGVKLAPVCLLAMAATAAFHDPVFKPRQLRFFSSKSVTAFDSVLAKIPSGASISAHTYFLPHLATRTTVYCFAIPFYKAGWGGGLLTLQQHDGERLYEMSDEELKASIREANADYILIGQANVSIMPSASYERLLRQLTLSKEYALLEMNSDFMLFHRGDDATGNRAKVQSYLGKRFTNEADLMKALSEWENQNREAL